MPIYAYKCASCGFAKDVLQKISDAPLTQCPTCGQEAFSKQVTAAGFQLKGSGWYVTDFRDGNKGKDKAAADKPAAAADAGGAPAGGAEGAAKPAEKSESAKSEAPKAAAAAPAAASTPAAGAGS